MKNVILTLLLCFVFSANAQSSNDAKFCLKFDMKDLMGKQVFTSICEVTQRLTYQDKSAKWNCLIDNKETLVNLFNPTTIGYDYNRQAGFVIYSYENNNSPISAIMQVKGFPKNVQYTSVAQNKIFFGKSAPYTGDSVLFLKTATVTYELAVELGTKYLLNDEKCF